MLGYIFLWALLGNTQDTPLLTFRTNSYRMPQNDDAELLKLLGKPQYKLGTPDYSYKGPVPAQSLYTKEDFEGEKGSRPNDEFLGKISQIESSGGLNTQHQKITSGIHKGDHAVGEYGMMPNTAQNISEDASNPKSRLSKILGESYSDPQVEELQDMDKKELKKTLQNNPELNDKLARILAEKVKTMYNGNEEEMARAWNQGTSDRVYAPKGNEYVEKFRNLKNYLSEK